MKEVKKIILVAFSSSIVGALIVIGSLKLSPYFRDVILPVASGQAAVEKPVQEQNPFDRFFKNDSLFGDDIFRSLDSFHKKFEENFSSFESPGIGQISQREDENYVYFDVQVDDLKSTSIETQVEDGQLLLSGTVEKKSGDDGDEAAFSSSYKSTFQRSLPVPEGVDAMKMQVTNEKNKVIIKFPKLNASV
jgi:HSP20 family molecular chaperone IbpA